MYAVLVLICIILFDRYPYIYGIHYTFENATNKFNEFKSRYNKQYENAFEEQLHYTAFVNNLNAAADLNTSSPNSNTIYMMNKYADLDPKDVEETYAIHLRTYDAVHEGDHQGHLRSDHGVEINDKNLFNLKNSDDLFEKYVQDENRKFKGEKDGFIHFYRFVKTLADKNRGIYDGRDVPHVGHKADILRETQEYFY